MLELPERTHYSVLIDNNPGGAGYATEHGLSLWIEHKGRKILFDTGASGQFLANAARAQIDVQHPDAVVLSHGHYDHTGGLEGLVDLPVYVPIYLHRDSFSTRFSRKSDGRINDISMPVSVREFLEEREKQIVFVEESIEIFPDMFLTGPIERKTDFEDTGGDFYHDRACKIVDDVNDDLSIFVGHSDGSFTVFCGCCHSGIVNTIEQIREQRGDSACRAIIGGIHLNSASETRLKQTREYLGSIGRPELDLRHCTGAGATEYFMEKH